MLVLDDHHRKQLSKPLVRVVFEVIFFAILGLIIGITLTYIFPNDVHTESAWASFGWLIFQVIVNAVVIFFFDKSYFLVFGTDSDEYIGITIFTSIMLLSQVQLFNRIKKIYYATTGKELISHKIPK